MRTPAGFLLPIFLFSMNNNQNNAFEKLPLSIEAQLERLGSRGITIQNRDIARHYLSYISYYRFCGYAIEFEIDNMKLLVLKMKRLDNIFN